MGRVSMDFDAQEDERIAALKQEYGIKQTTELIRFLITHEFRETVKPAIEHPSQ
jgi:hypothetical protein